MSDKKDEELSFDFSKITKAFKSEKKEETSVETPKAKAPSEELTVDVKGAINFVKKHKVLFLVLIPLFLSF